MTDLASVLVCVQVHIQFYTNEKKYESIFSTANTIPNRVTYNNPVNEKKVSEILNDSDASLLFIPSHFKDSITTKFMEIIASRTPIVAIGTEGEASTFIVKNRLGIFIPYSNISSGIMNLKTELDNLDYNNNFDTKLFHFSNQAEQILNIIKAI
jgi:hypothetical protein